MLPISVVRSLFVVRRPPTVCAVNTNLVSSGRHAASSLRAAPILLAAIGIVFCSIAHAAPTAHYSGGQSTVPTGQLITPNGVAVDAAGSVYIANISGNGVLKETLSGGVYTESVVPTSQLESPDGVAVDAAGNVYIVDSISGQVLKETLSAGSYTESMVPFSGLSGPEGIAVDAAGNVYVADLSNKRVVKATLSGNSYTQSTLPTSGLDFPEAVAVDAAGDVYIADFVNYRVLKLTLSGGIYTQQSAVGDLVHTGGGPEGVAVDAGGNVYIVDDVGQGKKEVLKETLSGSSYIQSTVASSGRQDPEAIAVDAGGDVYIAFPDNLVEKLQGPTVGFGLVNIGSISSAISLIFTFDTAGKLGSPAAVTQGAVGLDFADAGTGSCTTNGKSHAYLAGDACTIDVTFKPRFSGTRYGAALLQDGFGNVIASGYIYGIGSGAQATFLPGTGVSIDTGLAEPFGVAVDGNGNVFFTGNGTGTVYKETRSGGIYLKTAIAVGLNHPTGVAVDGIANVYVAASDVVYKETLSNGGYSQSEIAGGLDGLIGVAVDRSGNVYLTSAETGGVYKETLQATGSYTQTQIGSGFTGPTGVAVDGSGNVYVTNANSSNVYKETLQANGSYIQTTVAGGVDNPQSVAVDGNGNLYIASPSGDEIYKEALQANGSYVQTIAAAGVNQPASVAVDGKGNLYLSHDTARGDLAMIDIADPPSLSFAQTKIGSTSSDSPKTVTVANVGNAALVFPVTGAGANPSIATSFALGSATTCPEVPSSGTAGSVDAGSSCIYAIDFMPASHGSINGSLLLTDTNLNAANPTYALQSIALSGTGIGSEATRTTMRVSPNPVTAGLGVTITVTVKDTTTPATVPDGGGVTFTDSVGGEVTSLNGGAAVPLSNGTAILTMIPLAAGAHTITAHYGGVNDSFAGSTGQASLTVLP